MTKRRGKLQMTIQDIANITTALSHYDQFGMSMPQHDPKNEQLREWWTGFIMNTSQANRDKYFDQACYQVWQNIDFHYVQQMWSNTSCGWESMGGSAMSSAYTTVIVNYSSGLFFCLLFR